MRDTVKIPKNLSEPEWGALGKINFQRSYARPKPDGSTESWAETVKRVVDGNCSYVDEKFIEPYEAQKLFYLIYNMEFMPAGRHLWATGIKSGSQFISNCHCAPFDPNDFSRHFTYTFLRLMEGGGTGGSVSNRFVRQYPKVPHEVDLHLVCRPDHKDYGEMKPLLSDRFSWKWDGSFDVPDSREGWAEALGRLLDCYYNHEERIVIDLSHIRPSGAPLKTFGGTASGPHALAEMLMDVSESMNCYVGKKPDTQLFLDMDHAIAKAVLAGGTRRSARMACKHWSDPDIMDFVTAKRDGGHHTANFSVVVDKDFWTAYREGGDRATRIMKEMVDGIRINGEPGVLNATKHAEGELGEFFSTNPCMTGDTLIATADGRDAVPIQKLSREDEDVPVYSVSEDNEPCIKLGVNARKTGTKKPVYEVEVDGGGTLRLTADHKIPLLSGRVTTVKDLEEGDRLIPFTKYQYPDPELPYWTIYTGGSEKLREHRGVAEFYKGDIDGAVVHHKNGDTLDNRPENLSVMQPGQHNYEHERSMPGEDNPAFSGLTNDQLLERGIELTSRLGRRPTPSELRQVNVRRSLFHSSYRTDCFSSYQQFLQVCEREAGVPEKPEEVDIRTWKIHCDSSLDTVIKMDVEYPGLYAIKSCEFCGTDFEVRWGNREVCCCSKSCAAKLKHERSPDKKPKLIEKGYELYQECGSLPTASQWRESDTPACCGTVSREFGSWSAFKREVKNYAQSPNHRVTRVQFAGYEDVYNVTVQDTHTLACVTDPDAQTATGRKKFSGVMVHNCGEITFSLNDYSSLQGTGVCNLSSVNFSALSNDIPKLKESLRLGTRFLLRSTWADFHDEDLQKTVEAERRIGLGLMGFHPFLMDHGCKYTEFPHNDRMKDMFREFYDIVRAEAREYAFELRVPEPVKVTTVAPTGTSSTLPGTTPGMQPMEHDYYIRRVMFAAHDEEKMKKVRQLETTGFNVEDSVHEDNTKVVEFPLAAPALEDVDSELVETADDISIEQMLEVQAALQDTWADNAISVTVNFDPETSRERIEQAIAAYGPRLKGLTMMPWVSEVEQTPMERISEEEFFSYPEHLRQSADAASPCALNGACEFDKSHIQREE